MKTEVTEALRLMPRDSAVKCIASLYNGCIMLNPGLDIDSWVSLANPDWMNPFADNKLDMDEENFDFDKVKEKSKDNPVFYVQYAYARINSLHRALNINLNSKITLTEDTFELNENEEKIIKKGITNEI